MDKPGQLYVWNGIEGDLDEVSTIKEAKNYYKDYMEDGGIHPDIESIIILRQIGYIDIQETGETALTHDGEQEVCKIKIVISEPEMSFPSDQKLKELIEWLNKQEIDYSVATPKSINDAILEKANSLIQQDNQE